MTNAIAAGVIIVVSLVVIMAAVLIVRRYLRRPGRGSTKGIINPKELNVFCRHQERQLGPPSFGTPQAHPERFSVRE